jgi:purine-binding chemotaxis protein CheW
MSTTTLTPTPSVRTTEQQRQLVVFSMHGEHYALPITSVREIIRYTKPQATGAANGLIQGMILLRGQVLPIVDLSSRLGKSLEINDETRILVVELSERSLGLIVGTVDEVLMVAAEQIEAMPVSGSDLGEEIAKVGDRLITLIDAERALGQVLAD